MACSAPAATPPAGQAGDLRPYLTSTPAPQPSPEGLVPLTTPLPSPTPFTYTVQSGDSLSVIALKFGVSLDELQAANPEVAPNAMSVGQSLRIPSNPANPAGEPTPTPAPFVIEQIQCYPTANRGVWCFVLAFNDSPSFMENLSAQVTLVDEQGAALDSQTALLPLNLLAPHSALPLAVYFAPELPAAVKPQVQVLTGIQLLPEDARYIPVTIDDTLVQIQAGGHSAQVSGQVRSLSQVAAASQVWVAATAYDQAGRVVGLRRWEAATVLEAGASLPFEFLLSSLGAPIASVAFAVEARP